MFDRLEANPLRFVAPDRFTSQRVGASTDRGEVGNVPPPPVAGDGPETGLRRSRNGPKLAAV
jgi:hypothetical protein